MPPLSLFHLPGVVKIWDTRKLREPIFSLHTGSKSLIQIEWCSTRSGILASIGKEESILKLWDLNDSALDIPADPTNGQPQELNLKYTRPCRSTPPPLGRTCTTSAFLI
jgi:WD40 repeat protein